MLSRLYSERLVELERQLVEQTVRAQAAESSLAFERGQREHATARLIEMGRQAIQCKEEATALRMAQSNLETTLRIHLGDRVSKDMDQCYQHRTRDLEDLVARRLANRPLSKQDEQDLKDLILSTLEEFRMIVRRAL